MISIDIPYEWEYRVEVIDLAHWNMEKWLNAFGQERWELVSETLIQSTLIRCVFKRLKRD